MAIVRGPRPETGWYALDRRIAGDERLSWAARGLLIFLLTKPDHWSVSVKHLQDLTAGARIKTGRDGIYALLAELEAAGYLTTGQSQREDGKFGEANYVVREVPETPEPFTAEPFTAEPILDKTDFKKRQKEFKGEAPDWVPADAWEAFSKMRREIRAPLTQTSIERTLRALEALKAEGQDPGAVLWQSVQRGWRGVFAVAAQKKPAKGAVEASNAAALEEFKRRRSGVTIDA